MSRFIAREAGAARIFLDPWAIGRVFGGIIALEVVVLAPVAGFATWRDVIAFSTFLAITVIIGAAVVFDHARNPVTIVTADGLALRAPKEILTWAEIAEIRIIGDQLYLARRARSGFVEHPSWIFDQWRNWPPWARVTFGGLVAVFVIAGLVGVGEPLIAATRTPAAQPRPIGLGGATAAEVAALIAEFAPRVPIVRAP